MKYSKLEEKKAKKKSKKIDSEIEISQTGEPVLYEDGTINPSIYGKDVLELEMIQVAVNPDEMGNATNELNFDSYDINLQ